MPRTFSSTHSNLSQWLYSSMVMVCCISTRVCRAAIPAVIEFSRERRGRDPESHAYGRT